MPVSLIPASDTYPLRLKVLRPGSTLADTHFDSDLIEGFFHMGLYLDGRIVVVASFHPRSHPALGGEAAYQLRGMATDPAHAGKGHGSTLLQAALEELKRRSARLLWCNARIMAVPFYQRHGLVTEGPEFEIPGIGRHCLMWRGV